MPLAKLLSAAIARVGGQAQLAATVGVAQTTVSAWVRGAALPPRTRIPAMALALSVAPSRLHALVARERRRRLVGRGGAAVRACRQRNAAPGAKVRQP